MRRSREGSNPSEFFLKTRSPASAAAFRGLYIRPSQRPKATNYISAAYSEALWPSLGGKKKLKSNVKKC